MTLKERGYASPRNEWQLRRKKVQALFKAGILAASGEVNPPIFNKPTLAVSDLTAPGGTIVVNDTLQLTATTSDTDGFVTSGVDLYAGGIRLGAMTGGPTSWTFNDVGVPFGTRHYTARRITNGGSADSNDFPVVVNGISAPTATSSVSAAVGPFPTTSDRFSVTGSGGPDLIANSAIGVIFEINKNVSGIAQTIWSYSSATAGWYLSVDNNASTNITLIVRNAGVSTTYSATNLPIGRGMHSLWLSRDAGTNLHISIDGGPAVSMTASFAYTNCGADGQNVIGGVNTALVSQGWPVLNGRVLGVAYLNANVSDANLAIFSNVVNTTERYLWPAAVTGHANAVSVWHATDWDGVSATTTASHGSGAYTWTKSGSVPKATIKAENIYTVRDTWFHDAGAQTNATYTNGGTYRQRNAFARLKFALSGTPDRIGHGVSADVTLLPIGTWGRTGLLVDGKPAGSSGDGIQANGLGFFRITDWLPGSFQAGSVYELVDGLSNQNTAHAGRHSISIQTVRFPTDITPVLVQPTAPTNRLLVAGDSITQGSGILAPATGTWGNILRYTLGGVKFWGAGQEAWWDLCKDSGTITSQVAAVGAELDGTSTNTIWFAYGVNDWGGTAPWASVATFQTQVAAYLDALHTAFPSAIIYVQTPISKPSGEGANGSGQTLQQFRDALTTIAGTRAWINLVDGTTFCPSVTGPSLVDMTQGDAHPTQTGQMYCAMRASRIIGGFTIPPPWKSSGQAFSDSNIANAWVADDASTGGGATVSAWAPHKGSTTLTAAASPTYAKDYGALSLGRVTLNGTTQYVTGDGAASLFSGSNKPFLLIVAFQPVVVGVGKFLWCIDDSTTQGLHDFGTTTSSFYTTNRRGDSGTGTAFNSSGAVNTTKQVGAIYYDGKNVTVWMNGSVTSINGSAQDKNPMTVNQMTFGATRIQGAVANFYNATLRTMLLADASGDPGDQTTRQMCEGYLLYEANTP